MQAEPLKADKLSLIALRNTHHFDIVPLARQALVPPEIVYKMLLREPVARHCAIAVLKALSEQLGQIFTLNALDIPLLQESSAAGKIPFIVLRDRRWFEVSTLAYKADVHVDVVIRMILKDPVPYEEACKVLKAYSELAGTTYTPNMLDLKFSNQ